METVAYKFQVQTLKNGQKAIADVAQYTNMTDAEVAFHQEVAYNLHNKEIKDCLVQIIGVTGQILMEKWIVVEPVEETNS